MRREETPRQLVARWREEAKNPSERPYWTHDVGTILRLCAQQLEAVLVRAAAPATPPVTFGTTTVQGDAPSAPGTAPYGSAACAAHGPFDSRCETCPHCLQESSLKRLAASQPATPPGETAARRDHRDDIRAIVSSYGFLLMRLAVTEGAQDTYDVCKREFQEHEAALKRLQDAFIHNQPPALRGAASQEQK